MSSFQLHGGNAGTKATAWASVPDPFPATGEGKPPAAASCRHPQLAFLSADVFNCLKPKGFSFLLGVREFLAHLGTVSSTQQLAGQHTRCQGMCTFLLCYGRILFDVRQGPSPLGLSFHLKCKLFGANTPSLFHMAQTNKSPPCLGLTQPQQAVQPSYLLLV